MKKAYMKPEAEKLTFDFSENVTASFALTDFVNDYNPVCTNRVDYGDQLGTCVTKDQLHEAFSNYWVCNEKP
ncbi:MAG: hypothetical protein IKS31_00890 [Clostridia bacterium]|nr:hypothetical protein [Clostridia bacterium]